MSIFEEEWEDYELNKYDFEQWLDSINESGDPERDEEYYNKEMDRVNKTIFSEEIAEQGEQMDREAEEMAQVEYPEWVISSGNYRMIVSNN